MRNTGIEYSSTEHTPTVREDFANLLPPLSDEQLSLLEGDILRNGCYTPIIVNEAHMIVDGHNRAAICHKHGIPYRMAVFSFQDDLEAKQWALDTQKSRRNLSIHELCKIALKLRPEVEARAMRRRADNGGDKVSEEARAEMATLPSPLPDERSSVRKELAAAVGVGERIMGKAMKIEDAAPQAIKTAVDNEDISIHRGYTITQELRELPEEVREQAAAEAIALEIENHKKRKRKNDTESRIAKLFCAAFEKGVQVKPTEANIHIWIENAGVKRSHFKDMANDARQIAVAFSTIADVLEKEIKGDKGRGETDEEV